MRGVKRVLSWSSLGLVEDLDSLTAGESTQSPHESLNQVLLFVLAHLPPTLAPAVVGLFFLRLHEQRQKCGKLHT